MAYRLGVDIGASYTAAAVNHAGTPTMMRLGGESEKIPSALYLRQDGVTAVGEEAIALGTSRPTLLVRDFRARLGDRTPMLVAGSPYAPQALLARLLAWVVGQAKLQQGVGPDVVTLAYPASWGPFKQELMEQVWRLADLEGPPPVELCPEPVGVATLHAARIGVGEGGVVAVYDLGGTTFDATVLRRTADDFVVVGDPQTLTGSAGVAFDEAVMDHVLTRLEREHQSAPDAAAAPAERFRRSCIAAKEALSSDTEAVIEARVGDQDVPVRLVRHELETLIGPMVQTTVAAMHRAIRAADLEAADLDGLILTGGSASIPMVSELVSASFGCPLALHEHPGHDVALGAAMRGGAIVSSFAAPPEAAPTARVAEPTKEEGAGGPPHRDASPRSRRLIIAIAAAVFLAVVITGTVLLLHARNGGSASPPDTTTPNAPASSTPDSTQSTPSHQTHRFPDSAILLTKQHGKRVNLVEADSAGQFALTQVLVPEATLDGNRAWLPTISPDRSQVAILVGKGANGPFEIWLQPAAGGPDRHIIVGGSTPCQPGRPAFSPDGKRLAVTCGDGTLRVVTLTGHLVATPVTTGAKGNPTWTDDRHIVFGAESSGGLQKLFSIADDGTDRRQLTFSSGFDSHQDWSAAAGRLLFERSFGKSATPSSAIYVSNPDGAGFVPIPGTDGAINPTWSPDGSSIAFVRKTGQGSSLFTLRMSAGKPALVLGGQHNLGAPAWGSR